VFEIANISGSYASTPTILAAFSGPNGTLPTAGLVADASGNLYGTTYSGGGNGAGTVFEIAKTSSGYASTPTSLVTFDSTTGAPAGSRLIIDVAGNLYGTTYNGGKSGDGIVFEIAKTSSGYASTPTTLVTLNVTAQVLGP
jgi:uncharacterized repeat protein (TIGR03803 family)